MYPAEAQHIRKFLQFPATPCTAVDPGIGDGVAFAAITADAPAQRYGIELDSYRAAQASAVVDQLSQLVISDVRQGARRKSALFRPSRNTWG